MNIAPKLSAPRFDPCLENRKSQIRNPAKLLPAGKDFIKIFGRAPGPFTIAWRQPGQGPQRTTRATWAKAKKFADAKATELANLETGAQSLTPADAASYQRFLEIIAPTGKTPELAASEYAAAHQRLSAISDGPFAIADAITFFEQNRPRGFVPRPIPELVDQFLAQQEGELSADWHAHLAHALNRFAGHFQAPLHALRSADINAWLRALEVGARTRHNYRAAVEQLARWAQANGHLPLTWTEMQRVADPGQKMGEIRILSPEQMTKLLGARSHVEQNGRARSGVVQFLALQAFAGLRHSEAAQMDWRDVHFDQRQIYIPKGIAKGHRDRYAPMPDNLAAWLQPAARPNGPICPIRQISGALTKAKQAAGIPAGDNETRNVLRKSFITYRLAVTKSIAQVAEEAGNSPAIIRKHYGRPIPESEGQRWFTIWPTAAEVLQLNFAGL